MAALDFWIDGVHPVTGYRLNWHDTNERKRKIVVKYLKTTEFNPDLYIETKELMAKYNIKSGMLGIKIREAGFEKVTCLGKKLVLKEFEQHLINESKR